MTQSQEGDGLAVDRGPRPPSAALRVLHVVTLHSPDHAFGGPVRVSVNQALELRRRGHHVVIAGLSRGFSAPPTDIDGVPAVLRPARRVSARLGFSGLVSPSFIAWLAKNVRGFDVVHVHLARDLVTLPAARLAQVRGVPVVIQTHGMVDESHDRRARLIDFVATGSVLSRARVVLWLTPTERESLRVVAPKVARLSHLGNGVPDYGTPRPWCERRGVLFAARLHQRKRPLVAVAAWEQTRQQLGHDEPLVIAGPDEGELARVHDAIRRLPRPDLVRIVGAMDHSDLLRTMSQTRALILPSVDEPWPMSAVEALSLGVPVVITDSCGLADSVTGTHAGAVTHEDTPSVAQGLARVLREGPSMSRAARRLALSRYTMDIVIDDLEAHYWAAATSGPPGYGSH